MSTPLGKMARLASPTKKPPRPAPALATPGAMAPPAPVVPGAGELSAHVSFYLEDSTFSSALTVTCPKQMFSFISPKVGKSQEKRSLGLTHAMRGRGKLVLSKWQRERDRPAPVQRPLLCTVTPHAAGVTPAHGRLGGGRLFTPTLAPGGRAPADGSGSAPRSELLWPPEGATSRLATQPELAPLPYTQRVLVTGGLWAGCGVRPVGSL